MQDDLSWLEKFRFKPRETSPKITIDDIINSWGKFYKTRFGIRLEHRKIKIPKKVEGFDRLIIVANGITTETVFTACRRQFRCDGDHLMDDLDRLVKTNDRDPNRDGSYAIWVRDQDWADKELSGLSANHLKEQNIQGMTLLERLLFELKLYTETRRHLDARIRDYTLCSGSRVVLNRTPSRINPKPVVPFVRHRNRTVFIHFIGPDERNSRQRAREVIS